MDNKPQGLQGWIIIPLFGLSIYPIQASVSAFQAYLPFFQDGYWGVLTDPASESYHPLWGVLLISEIILNVGLILFSIYLLYLIFSKHRSFPKFFIIYMIANVVVVISTEYLASIMAIITEQQKEDSIVKIIIAIIHAAIWIPYFLFSKRVKNTFIEPAPNDQSAQGSAVL